jgi:hypothetical protein
MILFRRAIFRLRFFIILIPVLLIITLHKKSTDCENVCPYSSQLINSNIVFDSSHIIRHYPDFVCPQNFRNLADWIFSWPDQFKEHVEKTTDDGKIIAPCLPPGSIIYVRTWAIKEFFDFIYPYLINDFVLITGESDFSSPNDLQYLERSDSKIIHWFGQNGQYEVSRSNKFTHIPIGKKQKIKSISLFVLYLGINCYEMAEAIKNIYSQQLNYTLPPVFGDDDEPLSYIQPLDVTHRKLNQNLVLINFDENTDETGHRSTVWNDLCTSEVKNEYSFITCIEKQKGVQIEMIPKIYERNRQYPFWLSPRGNGIDCHRTWEALYLDIIPIVWNSSLNILYENLPVVIINDHRELNETFLYEKFNEISKMKLSRTKFYQYEKLRHAYWRRLILNKSRHKEKRDIYQRRKQCWRASSIEK